MTAATRDWRWHWLTDGQIVVAEVQTDGFWHCVLHHSTVAVASTYDAAIALAKERIGSGDGPA